MSQQLFMVDIETTGVNQKVDDILQIGILELTKTTLGFWLPGRLFELFLGTNKTPKDKFAIENMAPLYAKCNLLLPSQPADVWAEIKAFLTECGAPTMALATGQNASGFDLPFLYEKNYAKPAGRDPITNASTGDFHYRVYEMGGAISLAQDVLNQPDRKALEAAADAAYPEGYLPPGRNSHDAVYDCYSQTKKLNGLIRLVRTEPVNE